MTKTADTPPAHLDIDWDRQLTDAKVIEHSVDHLGHELVTIEATMHRFVLAELNTHRAFSRNSQSSRAIPVMTQLARLADAPAMFLKLPAEQSGMSGGAPLQGEDLQRAMEYLEDIANHTYQRTLEYIETTEKKNGKRLHKSLMNRPLEWFMWHRVVITSAEWQNFFSQRCSPAAQPEFEACANAIRDAIEKSDPISRVVHTPYLTDDERQTLDRGNQMRVSSSRCAGVSYLNHDREPNVKADLDRYRKLTSATPPHWSPLEHVAVQTGATGVLRVRGNFAPHWVQMRQLVESDNAL